MLQSITRGWPLVGVVALTAACARTPTSGPPPATVDAGAVQRAALLLPDSGIAYSGLVLGSAAADATVVPIAAVEAGPAARAGLTPADRIVGVDGHALTRSALAERLALAAPGEVLRLAVLRDAAPRDVELTLDDRARWTGPAQLPARVAARDAPPLDLGDAFDDRLVAVGANPAVIAMNQRLHRAFRSLGSDDVGRHKLPLIRAALLDPLALARWQAARRAALMAGTVDGVVDAFCTTLALPCPVRAPAPSAALTINELTARLTSIAAAVERVFERAPRALLDADLRYLVEQTASGRLIHGQAEATRAIGLMQAGMHVDRARLLDALAGLLALAALPAPAAAADAAPPAALLAQVEGSISAWAPVGDGFLVVGGSGVNRYRMRTLYAVFDHGGDDHYAWDAELAPPLQFVVDADGDDRYEASYGGPGSGWLGIAVLLDQAGDDHYRSVFGGCGAGLLGFGVLIDDDGSDRYRCDAWSNGAGLYGGGALLDKGDRGDAYLSQFASQGVGGPDGVGVLFDADGADLYRANGLVDSVYATPAVFAAFSQGVGYGLRPHDHGGVGLLLDGGGDDRYEGGEFSQGGGYFWGAGVLADAAGNDLYYGNRYAQGFAAHQAAGLLLDGAGDDQYWAMTAAAQGAAWDQSVAMLYDGTGNDSYRASALSQGAAAQQARAVLHDGAGDDRYWSDAATAQGAAGSNAYHFEPADPIYSLGLLQDDGGDDRYSRPLAAGALRIDLLEPPGADGVGRVGIARDRD